jgi:hypothetical protein
MELGHPANGVLGAEMRPEHFPCLLQILTANALDWLREAAVRRIRVAVSGGEGTCAFVFGDTGPGIPAGLAERVFEAGFSMKESGRGMGLTIARRLAEGHGGRLEVLVDGRRRGAKTCGWSCHGNGPGPPSPTAAEPRGVAPPYEASGPTSVGASPESSLARFPRRRLRDGVGGRVTRVRSSTGLSVSIGSVMSSSRIRMR